MLCEQVFVCCVFLKVSQSLSKDLTIRQTPVILTYMTEQLLHSDLTLRETIALLVATERQARSRFRFGSPCRFIRSCDIFFHIFIPEVVEVFAPRIARYLRSTSPRWGRSWRTW